MATKTTNYNLVKPTDNEFAEISVMNANMDIIDTGMNTLDIGKEGLIKNATDKITLADTDEFPLVDSTHSSKTKKITFANIKSILKTYFDILYNKTVIANNLITTIQGNALDATQGKILSDSIFTVQNALSQVSSIKTAGGTSTAITLVTGNLFNGYTTTFIASSNSGGSSTTINGVPLYKPNTTTAPTLIAGKAYTVWYNSTTPCFFIKASAEGTTVAENVLAGKTFSNDNDIGILGSMPNNGTITKILSTSGEQYNIPAGYHNGNGKVIAPIYKEGCILGNIVPLSSEVIFSAEPKIIIVAMRCYTGHGYATLAIITLDIQNGENYKQENVPGINNSSTVTLSYSNKRLTSDYTDASVIPIY